MTDHLTDNEVICQFMGFEIVSENPLIKGIVSEQLHKFESSWSWLMPVWYKFRDLKIDIKDGLLAYHFRCDNITKEILNGGPSPLEACKLLAEGIRWYNSTTQNKEQS